MKTFVVFAAIAIALVAAGDHHERGQWKERREMMREKWANMPEEERQAHRQEKQQKMKERFDSLTPEQQEKVKNKVSLLMPDAARAYDQAEGETDKKIQAFFDNISPADKERAKEHFKSLTPEQRKQFMAHARGSKHHGRSMSVDREGRPSRNDRRPRPVDAEQRRPTRNDRGPRPVA